MRLEGNPNEIMNVEYTNDDLLSSPSSPEVDQTLGASEAYRAYQKAEKNMVSIARGMLRAAGVPPEMADAADIDLGELTDIGRIEAAVSENGELLFLALIYPSKERVEVLVPLTDD